MNHKKALFCVRLHCTVIPITSSRKVSCVRCVVLPLRPGKSLISPGPRSQGRRCSSAARTRARQGRPQGVGQGSKAPAAEQSAEEVLLTLSTFHSSDNSCLLKIIIQSSNIFILAKPLLQKFSKVCGLSNADCMERLQDQTRSEESGQGVTCPRDSTAVTVREGAERNSTFAEWRVMKNISDTGTSTSHG